MNKEIKNIVFDLGGVIMGLDVPRTILAFEKLGITNIVNKTGHHYTNEIFYDFETGKVSENEFRSELRRVAGQDLTNNKIDMAWNEMILDIPLKKAKVLKQLSDKFNIFLLSNTNSIHKKKFESEFFDNADFDFNELFRKTFYSHIENVRKPDLEAYQNVLDSSNIIANESLFVDDSLENIKAAARVGYNTYHIKSINDFYQLSKNLR